MAIAISVNGLAISANAITISADTAISNTHIDLQDVIPANCRIPGTASNIAAAYPKISVNPFLPYTASAITAAPPNITVNHFVIATGVERGVSIVRQILPALTVVDTVASLAVAADITV